MKRYIFILAALFSLFTAGCEIPDDPVITENYSKDYWGEWIRMDTGKAWYITSSSITKSDASGSVSLYKQSDNVIEVSEGSRKYYLYASRVANARFMGKVAGFEQASTSQTISRSVAGGKGFIQVVIEDLNDKANTTKVITDGNGNFTVDDAIPGNGYKITPEGGTPVTVVPLADGDDVGTITIVNGNEVNFKVSIAGRNRAGSNNDDFATNLDLLCVNGYYYSYFTSGWVYSSNPTYHFTLSIRNTGNTDATAATYELSDSGLSGSSSGILGTIEPGKEKDVNISLSFPFELTDDYAFKTIGVTINDPINNRTWSDSVSLRVFKEIIPVTVEGSADYIIIPPSGNALRKNGGRISSGMAGGDRYGNFTILPKLTSGDYLIVFSGATASSESAYSISFPGVAYQDSVIGIDTARYEPNDTEDTATVIIGGIHGYLHKNDIDYYRFRFDS